MAKTKKAQVSQKELLPALSRISGELLIVPLKDLVIFPTMVISVFIEDLALLEVIVKASQEKKYLGLFTQKSPMATVPPIDNLYMTGTAGRILQVIREPSGTAMVILEGVRRIRIQKVLSEKPFVTAEVEELPVSTEKMTQIDALLTELRDLLARAHSLGKPLPEEVILNLPNIIDAEMLGNIIASYMQIEISKKIELLEMTDVLERLKKIHEYLNRELQVLQLRGKIRGDVAKEMSKTEREFLLRQELKAIQKELGEEEGELSEEIREWRDKIKKSAMPKEVEKIAMQELNRLKRMFPASPEYQVSRTYIEWLYDMPWNKSSADGKIDIEKARKILDEDHYGLEKVKERILEYLAVCQVKGECGTTILCFVGPPGTGKTSLGQSIARALGRVFIRTSLGGMRDEAEIRGHRRTYVGALPGRIIQRIRRAGCNNPVFMMDEIDKLSHDFMGDPASALLEALDPEQNLAFTDHYLDVPFDLSKTFFILTANFVDPIPPALLDRMEVIELPGYTEEEKLQIAKRYLFPKQLKAVGLGKKPFTLTDDAIIYIIRSYTREAGLREVERKIATICRKMVKKMLETKKRIDKVAKEDVPDFLGVEEYLSEAKQAEDHIGVATGLAWTPSGGDIIFVETSQMKGNKGLIMTGQLGEIMQESAKAALSYVRSMAKKFGIQENFFDKSDIHIHVPEGAIPKDGPSAGITIGVALVSLLKKQKIRRDVAMTGEITLTGNILPVGGIKEKILAACRAGVNTIILPERNRKDLKEIPDYVKKKLKVHFAKTLDDAVKAALVPEPSKKTPSKKKTSKKNKK